MNATRLQSPSTLVPFTTFVPLDLLVAAVVQITNGAHVRMAELTITGPVPCDVESGGIAVVEGARLELKESRVTRIRPETSDPSCSPQSPAGAAIRIGLTGAFSADGMVFGSTAHGKITEVTVDRYFGAGIVVGGPPDGATSTATIATNVISGGAVPFAVAGQAGISIRQNAVAR